MDKRYQIFVSSTFADLEVERGKVIQTVLALDCFPAGMEMFPAMDEEIFEYIKRIIDDSDYYLLIIGGRYGDVDDSGVSWTEKEFDYAKQKGLPILAFLHNNLDSIPLGKSEKDPVKRDMLNSFREKASTGRVVKFWENPGELVGQVATSLSVTIMQYPAVGWVRANLQSTTEALVQENELRKELASVKNYVSKLEKERNEAKILKNLATFDDMVIVRFVHTKWSNTIRRDEKTPYELSLSWGELFESIAPRLMENPNDERAYSIIGEVLGEKKGITNGIIRLNKEDFDTIKIQLLVLELIDVLYQKTVNGSMALLWVLTSKGKSLMIQRRAVRKK